MGVDYNKLWEEVTEAARKENEILPEEKTIQDLMKEWGMGRERVRNTVNKMVDEGKLSKRWVMGKNYYKPIAE